MINSITTLLNNNPKYIKDFLKGCTIEEKIDTHYITIDIISRNDIKIRKANGNEIDRVDMILNSMWSKLFLDWNYLKLSNKEWFASHVGYSIKAFYFPCETPILTTYKPGIRYIFDRILFNNVELDTEYIISDIKFPDVYQVAYKHCLTKDETLNDEAYEALTITLSGGDKIHEVIKRIISPESNVIYAANDPEGYVLKYNSKIYQYLTHPVNRKIDQEKTSYEFLLSDFIKYCKLHNYTDKITQSYTQTVCNLFNDYIINGEKQTHTLEKNIDVDSIEPPYLGAKFEIGYEYIPDQVTKTLCQESELFKNVFKVLLANLRKGKDYSHCIFLTKKEVSDWNNIMKSIKIRNIYI